MPAPFFSLWSAPHVQVTSVSLRNACPIPHNAPHVPTRRGTLCHQVYAVPALQQGWKQKEQIADALFLTFWKLCVPQIHLMLARLSISCVNSFSAWKQLHYQHIQINSWVMPGFFSWKQITESWKAGVGPFFQSECARIRCSIKINCDESTPDLLAGLRTPNHTETRNNHSSTEPGVLAKVNLRHPV